MKKIGKKGKVVLFLVVFLLTTPLIIFYSLEGLGIFDTRSQARFDWDKCPYSKADLTRDTKVGIEDFNIWLREFRSFKNDPSTVKDMADLDGDGRIGINDFAIWLNLWREFKGCQGNVMRCRAWCYAAGRRINFEEYGRLYRCSDTETTLPDIENCWMLGFNPSATPIKQGEQLRYLRLELEEDSMCSFPNGREEVCSYAALDDYYQGHFGSIYTSVDGYYEQGAAIRVSSMGISGKTVDPIIIDPIDPIKDPIEPIVKSCTNADEVVNVNTGETFELSITFTFGGPYHPYPPVYNSKVLKIVSQRDVMYEPEPLPGQEIVTSITGSSVERTYTFEALRATHYTCSLVELGLSHVHYPDKRDEKTVAVFVSDGTVPISAEAYCNEIAGAEWIAEYDECELLGVTNPQQYAASCVKFGGVYDDCASACRHVLKSSTACINVCVPLCDFGVSSIYKDPPLWEPAPPEGPALM